MITKTKTKEASTGTGPAKDLAFKADFLFSSGDYQAVLETAARAIEVAEPNSLEALMIEQMVSKIADRTPANPAADFLLSKIYMRKMHEGKNLFEDAGIHFHEALKVLAKAKKVSELEASLFINCLQTALKNGEMARIFYEIGAFNPRMLITIAHKISISLKKNLDESMMQGLRQITRDATEYTMLQDVPAHLYN